MKKLLLRFNAWCGEKFGELMDFNATTATKTVPGALAKMPLVLALPAWLLFVVFWIAIAGPITLAVEAVLYPFVMMDMFVGEDKDFPLWRALLDAVMMAVLMLFYFVLLRFIFAAAAFDEGIWKPRVKKSEHDVRMAAE